MSFSKRSVHTNRGTRFGIHAAGTTIPGMSRGQPEPRRSGVCWSRVCAAGSGRGTGGRSREREAGEGVSFRSPRTQGPHGGSALPTPCGAPGPPSSASRPPPGLSPVRLCTVPASSSRMESWRLSPFTPQPPGPQVWESSPPLPVRPGPPPNAPSPSCFWDPAPGWSGNPLRSGSERPTAPAWPEHSGIWLLIMAPQLPSVTLV